MDNEKTLLELRRCIERIVGFIPSTPRDFDTLSESIFQKKRQRVSASTLKRIWGYSTTGSVPRQSTLDILARFAGYRDYRVFCLACNDDKDDVLEVGDEVTETVLSGAPEEGELPVSEKQKLGRFTPYFLFLIILAIVAGAAYLGFSHRTPHGPVIKKGQTFATYQDYLVLFGIHAKDTLWGQRLPHHPSISIWGPRYHHHRWHNYGDSALLMPTITERWEPDDGSADSALIAVRNNDHYLAYRDINEIRITFMQGLTPDGDSLTFCGVYRMDLEHSNTHHVTWVRVADEVNLAQLDYLEELKN
ncbi:MAG: hypothetical protein J5548_02410 [Prevotella sp.]|nr:hypothetical protein [Prevotella sp.]